MRPDHRGAKAASKRLARGSHRVEGPCKGLATAPEKRFAAINRDLSRLTGADLVAAVLEHPEAGPAAVVSSFGADSVVLLDLVARVAPRTPVLFIDTQMLFPETLDYQRQVAATLGLTDIRLLRARALHLARQDPANVLHQTDPDACCDLRKTRPLRQALAPFDTWLSGRKRFQSDRRTSLPVVEEDGARIKVNPLAGWSRQDIADHITRRGLPRHPLVAKGYPSIGCGPCTSAVQPGEDPRAGRWRNAPKDECGIHFINGQLTRTGPQETRQ